MKNISILGSTGSIGTQALSIAFESKELRVSALTCHKNIKLMEKQARQFKPEFVAVWDEKDALDLRERLRDTNVSVGFGMEGLIRAASLPGVDMVLTAVVGMIGIEPTIAAIKEKKTIALANKETLVCAGDIIMPLARKMGVSILPVDSEHSAIFQSLEGRGENEIKKIILTASGGPFFGKTREDLKKVKLVDALNHPNWSMGKKITIDSATLINKGLEVIEACHLFNVPPEKIEVVIHRESILHSAVEYEDGAIIGLMGTPDMKLPIAYAFYYPKRVALKNASPLSLSDIGKLSFYKPNLESFLGLSLCISAAKKGGNMPAIINAANEIAVGLFLKEKIEFLDIYDICQRAMEEIPYNPAPGLNEILEIYPRLQEIFNR